MTGILAWLYETWLLFVVSAPWLFFGFLTAGFIKTLIPRSFIERALQKPGAKSVATASLIGIPLPLCSCSVIPVAVSLRRAGASRGSTASFMVSTPEIGVDSYLLSYVLLGPFIAAARVIASFVSAFTVGIAIETWGEHSEPTDSAEPKNCCKSSHQKSSEPTKNRSLPQLLRESLTYGFGDIVDDLSKLLILGFLIAGAAAYLLPPDLVASANLSKTTTMLIAILISMPVYICSTSTTPLAAALLLKGVSPGAIIVFLLAGPATNITTMLAVKQELGMRSLGLYLAAIAVTTLGAGFLLDSLIPNADYTTQQSALSHSAHYGVVHIASAVFLLALITYRLLRKHLPKSNSAPAASANSAACH
ncbi:MAG: SO_0444 family Cu/Zn efflux transporter [Bdellovibrionales bacterium]|nr:SO_0444 family Cu/Zn efflux transporter [Bdellovibrionales bacterium]